MGQMVFHIKMANQQITTGSLKKLAMWDIFAFALKIFA
jgi:hypothetical protein